MQPVAKTSDPTTSWEAGEAFHASGKVKDHHNLILATLNSFYPYTAAEIAQWCPLDRYQISRRMGELNQNGLVERTDPFYCSVIGSKCTGWKLTQSGEDRVAQLIKEAV